MNLDFITTMLVGNNIALVVYGIVIAELLAPRLSLYVNTDFVIIDSNNYCDTNCFSNSRVSSKSYF